MDQMFPRTYRASAGWRVFAVALGGGLAVFAVLGVWYFGTGRDPKTQGGAAVMLTCVCLLFAALGAYLLYSILHFRVVLTTDSIEVRIFSGPRMYPRQSFSGWRSIRNRNAETLELRFAGPSHKSLKFPQYFPLDDAFFQWLEPLANLDIEERLAAEREIANNDNFGMTVEERMASLASARRTCILLNIIAVGACVWALFYPRPYSIAVTVLALLPWISVIAVVRSRGLIRIDQRRNDPHPFVAIPLLMPSIILALRAIFDVHLIGWQLPLASSIAIGTILWYSGFRADASMQRAAAIAFFLLLPAYGFGVFALFNALLDHSLATRYSVHVIDKYINSGRSTTYHLRLEPWGPETQVTSVDVSRYFYDATPKDSIVCVYLRGGAFHTPWFVVRHCPQQP